MCCYCQLKPATEANNSIVLFLDRVIPRGSDRPVSDLCEPEPGLFLREAPGWLPVLQRGCALPTGASRPAAGQDGH